MRLPFLLLASAAAATPARASFVVVWTDGAALGIGGRAYPSQLTEADAYARLPAAAQADVTQAVWGYSRDSAGLFIQFETNSSAIYLNVTLAAANKTAWADFSEIGASGADLYRYDTGNATWRWIASTFNAVSGAGVVALSSPLFADSEGWPVGPVPSYPALNASSRYRLHLPSYNGVTQLRVGVHAGALLRADPTWRSPRARVALYSTSIGQGGITARPGSVFSARVSRALDAEVLNLGFCGACQMETPSVTPGRDMAKWVAGVEGGVNVTVVDCAWNMPPALIAQRAVPFLTALRAALPASVSLLVVGPSPSPPTWLVPDGEWLNVTGREAEMAAAAAAVAAAFPGVHYLPGTWLFNGSMDGVTMPNVDPLEDVTFEGTHPMDYGHALLAAAYTDALQTLLAGGALPPPPAAPVTSSAAAAAAAAAAASSTTLAPRSWGSAWATPDAAVTYVDAQSLAILGRAFPPAQLPGPYTRLPSAAKGVVRDAVWDLSLDSAGLWVSFATDSPGVWVNLTCAGAFEPTMPHFAVSGVSGADLFALDPRSGRYRHVAPLQLRFGEPTFAGLVTPPNASVAAPGAPVSYALYLPTYNTALAVAVGVLEGASLAPVPQPFGAGAHRVLWYGTSILQGGVATRVGDIFSSAVSRALGAEVLNFGFSGNGKMETAVAQFLVAVPGVDVIIVDCDRNMDAATVAAAAPPLVAYLRAHGHAATPIVLAEGTAMGRDWSVVAQSADSSATGAALRAAYDALVSAGDPALHYVAADELWAGVRDAAMDSPTAAGLHPNSEGMRLVAATWARKLRGILGAPRRGRGGGAA